MAEWSKAVDLSPAQISTTEMCVGSNPTRVILHFFATFCGCAVGGGAFWVVWEGVACVVVEIF